MENDFEINPLTLSGNLIPFKTYGAQMGAGGGWGMQFVIVLKI